MERSIRWPARTALLVLFASVGPAGAQTGGSGPVPVPEGRKATVARLTNPTEMRTRLGLVPEYANVPGVESLRIAVLDYGFEGLNAGRPYLPEGSVVVEHYDPDFVRRNDLGDPEYRKPFEPGNRHGRDMAQIVWAMTGSKPAGPRFYLLNANGPTMLRRAVRYAVEARVDLILFSGSFEGGGNGDGRGPINRIADEALAAGIPWINAAGNYGRRVYNGPVRLMADGYLRLRKGADVAALRFRNHVDENLVTVTLTWSDYRDQEDAGTGKDLDLFVEDWAGRRIGSGEKAQVMGSSGTLGPEESRNPRERVVLLDLPANPDVQNDPDYCYRIRVRARSGHFTAADRLRILVTTGRETYIPIGRTAAVESVEFLDATGEEELFPPADHPLVLTVGDSSWGSSVGPTADRRLKPDVLVEDSRAYFTDGSVSAGSSNAAAYVAGVVAVLKTVEPGLGPRHLLRFAQLGDPISRSSLLPPPPLSTGVARPPAPTPMTFRAWKTPTRARLAEVMRGTR